MCKACGVGCDKLGSVLGRISAEPGLPTACTCNALTAPAQHEHCVPSMHSFTQALFQSHLLQQQEAMIALLASEMYDLDYSWIIFCYIQQSR